MALRFTGLERNLTKAVINSQKMRILKCLVRKSFVKKKLLSNFEKVKTNN